MNELTFGKARIELITRDGELWARAGHIGLALGYADEKAIHRIYARHKDEFTDTMTGVVKLTTPSGEQETRIFSLRGAHLLAMFARTETAKEFRRWVLDILDSLQKGGEYVMQQYRAAYDALEQSKDAASKCGKGLNKWKQIKKPLQARVERLHEQLQLTLGLDGEHTLYGGACTGIGP